MCMCIVSGFRSIDRCLIWYYWISTFVFKYSICDVRSLRTLDTYVDIILLKWVAEVVHNQYAFITISKCTLRTILRSMTEHIWECPKCKEAKCINRKWWPFFKFKYIVDIEWYMKIKCSYVLRPWLFYICKYFRSYMWSKEHNTITYQVCYNSQLRRIDL